MPRTKIIYALRIHVELQKRGFNYITEMRNPKNPHLNCWVYELTEELERTLDELLGGMYNG